MRQEWAMFGWFRAGFGLRKPPTARRGPANSLGSVGLGIRLSHWSALLAQHDDERFLLARPMNVGDAPAGRCPDEIERDHGWLLLALRREARGAGGAVGARARGDGG